MTVSQRVFDVVLGNVFGMLMSLGMSFAMLAMSVGIVEGFVGLWLRSAATSFAISMPIAILVFPLGGRLLQRVLRVEES